MFDIIVIDFQYTYTQLILYKLLIFRIFQSSSSRRALLFGLLEDDTLAALTNSSSLSPVLLRLALARFLR